jgi:hypothetical protein
MAKSGSRVRGATIATAFIESFFPETLAQGLVKAKAAASRARKLIAETDTAVAQSHRAIAESRSLLARFDGQAR